MAKIPPSPPIEYLHIEHQETGALVPVHFIRFEPVMGVEGWNMDGDTFVYQHGLWLELHGKEYEIISGRREQALNNLRDIWIQYHLKFSPLTQTHE